MIAPNFEQQWMASDPPPETSAIKNMPPILVEITADMENHIWVELPESPVETPVEPSPERLVETEPRFTEAAIEECKQQDRICREELLSELRQAAETPPMPPIDESDDRDRDDDSQSIRSADSRSFALKRSSLRRCPACDGSGKRWLLLTCGRCGGLGAIDIAH